VWHPFLFSFADGLVTRADPISERAAGFCQEASVFWPVIPRLIFVALVPWFCCHGCGRKQRAGRPPALRHGIRKGRRNSILTAVQLDEITTALRARLSPQRLLHSLGTSHSAVFLANRWGCDPDDALLAALLHDVAKEESPSAQREIILRSEHWHNPEDDAFPSIWHAAASAQLASEEFGVSETVARAIALHPTGEAGMTVLEKVIFLSDYIEPTRTWEGVRDLRELARCNFEEAVRTAIFKKTAHVKAKRKPLHPRSQRALVEAGKGRQTA
jgi:predicted HD superfamily hydrolase involved in NAD metabolism